MITTERRIIGNLVGNYTELVELMELADRGKVHLAINYYKLDQANQALPLGWEVVKTGCAERLSSVVDRSPSERGVQWSDLPRIAGGPKR